MARYVMVREQEEDGDVVHHHHTHHHHHHGGEHATDNKYADSVMEVMEELADHPAEWAAYGTSVADLMQIVGMEWAQLQAAKNNSDHKRIIDELEDLAAACIHAHKHM